MSARFKLLILLLTLLPLPLPAEDLLAVYRLAQAYDPTLQAAKAAQQAASEALPQARAAFMPLLTATAAHTATRISSVFDNTIPTGVPDNNTPSATELLHYNQSSYGLTLTQPIFYYQQWVQYSQATKQIKQANATYAAAEQDLMARTVQLYFGALKAHDTLKFTKVQRKAFAKILEQAKESYKVGLVTITDVELAKAQLDNAHADEIAAENEFANQKEKLREITGQPIETFSYLRSNLILKSPEPDNLETWVNMALHQNLSLQASRFQAETLKENVNLTKANHLPSLSLNGALGRNSSTPNNPTNTSSSISLQVALPLFSGGAALSKTKQARALYEQAQKRLETLYSQVASNTRQNFRGVVTHINRVAALKQAIISNQSALRATEAAYKVGTRTIVDVLDAQTNLTAAEQNYANARYDYILQSILLKQAAGTLTPEDIQQINAWLNEK